MHEINTLNDQNKKPVLIDRSAENKTYITSYRPVPAKYHATSPSG